MNSLVRLESDELLALARHDLKHERYDAALLKLKQARSETSGQQIPAGVLAELGRLYSRLGLRARAKEAFQEFLAREPEALQERFELGLTLFEDGAAEAALGLWEQVLRTSPLHPPALFYSSLALAQRGSFAEALQLSQTLLSKVNVDNLYHGRAKDLIQRIEKDPNYRNHVDKGRLAAESRVQH